MAGVIVTILTGIGIWRLFQYENWNDARKDVVVVLIDVFETSVNRTINQVLVGAETEEQKSSINKLNRQRERLTAVAGDDDHFRGLASLATALESLIIRKDVAQARKELIAAANLSSQDTFVRSRALTLQAVIAISSGRFQPEQQTERQLREAISMDGTLALAFNGLGILTSNAAKSAISNRRVDDAVDSTEQAMLYYKLAADLDPSATGEYRRLNNELWVQLLLLQGQLDGIVPESRFLATVDQPGIRQYLDHGYRVLSSCRHLANHQPTLLETEAELRSVDAHFTSLTDEQASKDLLERACDSYCAAIRTGLLERMETEEAATSQYQADYLLDFVRRHKEMDARVLTEIHQWWAKVHG